MTTFTSSLPDHLLDRLSQLAKSLKLPKNKVIEKALELYLDQLERASYVKSYKSADSDDSILMVAEEGFNDYFQSIQDTDAS